MTQEKQKVIRVLQTNKKSSAKKPRKNTAIVASVVVGILLISGLLFAFLKNNGDENLDLSADSSKELDQQESNKSVFNKTSTQTAATDDPDPNEDIQHPQPKINEITNIFKHKKETQVAVTEKQPESSNPFDHLIASDKPNTNQVVDPTKNPLLKAAPPQKGTAQDKETKKTDDSKPAVKATDTKEAKPIDTKEKSKNTESEDIVAIPAVKIEITKKIKEE